MKRIALFTAAVMAISTAAMAQSRVVVHDGPGDVSVQWNRERYEGYDKSHWRTDFKGRWTPLAEGYSARTERQIIKIGGQGRYRKLRVEGVRGEPVILKIAIEFSDRTGQAVEYREALPRGTGEVIDLNGDTRRINRIIVYSDPHSRGNYSIYGA